MKKLEDIPEPVRNGDLLPVVSVSGGKDSTAVCLALREAGIEHRRVFADTGWEHSSTYEHMDMLREKLGPIDVVGVEGGMVGKIRTKRRFPSRLQRWCTRELKLQPLRLYHDGVEATGVETVSVVGIRAEESSRRAAMAVWEDDETWGGWMWRPIMDWTVDDVLAIHHRHGVEIHPLYRAGMSRVGCWPCINANKDELRIIGKIDPARIDMIRDLEIETTESRSKHSAKSATATFFPGGNTIDRVIEWARTDRGGKQLPLIQPDPTGGCFRWGLCEPPERAVMGDEE